MLVGHDDAGGEGVRRRMEMHLLAAQRDGAAIRLDTAGEDVHQRGLAGAVLAEHGMHGSGAHLQMRPVVRDHGVFVEPFGDLRGNQQHVTTRAASPG